MLVRKRRNSLYYLTMNTNEPSQPHNRIDLTTYEKNQHKRTLSTILIITLVASVTFGVLNLYFYNSLEPARIFFAVAILCLPAIWLNRRGYYSLAGVLTTVLVFFMAHHNLVDGAGIRDPGVVAYPLIILIGGMLFGKRAIPVFTITGIVSLMIVVWLDNSFTDDLDRLLIISVLILVGGAATRAVLGNIENNIGRLKESEEQLREALEQTRKHAQRINDIIETVPEGVLLLNGIHQVILVNTTAKEYLTLLAPGHLRNVSLEEIGPLRQIGPFSVEDLIHNSQVGWQDIVIDEPERIFEVAVRPVQNVPTPYKNWVLILRDATLERKQQETLQERERLALVGQLASGIAHDFRNILSVISIYSQIVSKRPQANSQKDYTKVIQEQIRDAARLIEQILDFGRRTIMQRRAIDFAELVESVIQFLRRTLPSNITITFRQEPGSYTVHGDSGRLRQTLVNLAVNARDAMPDGGTLTFSLSRFDVSGQIQSDSDKAAQEWLRLSVSDSGEGIASEDRAHIFEPFFTTKDSGKGTGLGLAQVFGIVKQHEGEITVSSERGQGTRFDLYFPTISESPMPMSRHSPSKVKIMDEVTILFVEDNALARSSTEEMLAMLGCRVMTAENGQEALSMYRDRLESIDLVISDIVMPHMNGLELYEKLQVIAPQLKFLVLTGYPLNEQARTLLEQGYIEWVQKPYQAEELAAKIGSLVGATVESI